MAMKGDPNIPSSQDRILVSKFRILGTTDDIYTSIEGAIKAAENYARFENKRIYVVQVIGYAQPERPPTTYKPNPE